MHNFLPGTRSRSSGSIRQIHKYMCIYYIIHIYIYHIYIYVDAQRLGFAGALQCCWFPLFNFCSTGEMKEDLNSHHHQDLHSSGKNEEESNITSPLDCTFNWENGEEPKFASLLNFTFRCCCPAAQSKAQACAIYI